MEFPKPPSRKSEKRAQKAHRASVIASVRREVMRRDRYQCRCCAKCFTTLEMHEIVSRAQLRGKEPEEIFNTANCIALCRACHRAITERRTQVTVINDTEGANGRVQFDTLR